VPEFSIPYLLRNLHLSVRQVVEEEPARPRQVHAGVSPALEAVCLRALAKKPANRYASAADLARDVQRWLADEPVTAYREPITVRLGRWARRHRILVVAAAVLLLTVGTAGAVGKVLLADERTRAERRRAAAEATQRARAESHLYAQRIALADRELAAGNLGQADQVLDDCQEALRGWEWGYLKRRRYRDVFVFRQHQGPVQTVAFSPDGRYAASAGIDPNVFVWEVETGRVIQQLEDHQRVGQVAFSPDGRQLAIAGEN